MVNTLLLVKLNLGFQNMKEIKFNKIYAYGDKKITKWHSNYYSKCIIAIQLHKYLEPSERNTTYNLLNVVIDINISKHKYEKY